jgi:hypothetical protein
LRCRFSVCGDGYVHESECGEADDAQYCNGATAPANIACKTGSCGDGYVNAQAGESCDPRQSDSVICNGPGANVHACQPAVCGDGYTNATAGEACDPGDPSPNNNGISNADESNLVWNQCNGPSASTLRCHARVCGDGFKHPKEECDAGSADTAVCNGAGKQGSGGASVECKEVECGDGYVNAAAGEECDPGSDALGGTVDWANCNGPTAGASACHVPRCGDGYKHEDECGETQTGSCNGPQAPSAVGCRTSNCGDGYINGNAGEECDVTTDTFACNGPSAGQDKCKRSSCGDGYENEEAGEDCDTGGPDSASCNGSSALAAVRCKTPVCGDGHRNASSLTGSNSSGAALAEACDNGSLDTAGCNGSTGRSACQFSTCGDGRVNKAAGEECDPSAPTSTWDRLPGETSNPPSNSCNTSGNLACKRSRCGDGYVNTTAGGSGPYEQCDPGAPRETWDGYPTGGDDSAFPQFCNSDVAGGQKCRFSICGDGVVSGGEECDPKVEDPDADIGDDTVDCNGGTAGARACKVSICGDGYENTFENCDPGLTGESLSCTSQCEVSDCGDGVVNRTAEEECDIVDGHWFFCNPDSAGSVGCRSTLCGDGYCNPNTEYHPSHIKPWPWYEDCAQDCDP